MQETQVPSLGREDILEKEMATHSSILPAELSGQRSLAGYSPWGCKESDTTERLTLHYLHFIFPSDLYTESASHAYAYIQARNTVLNKAINYSYFVLVNFVTYFCSPAI